MSRVFFKDVGPDATAQDILQLFRSATGLELSKSEVRLLHDRNTGKSRGVGFCDFEHAHTAKLVESKAHGKLYNGQEISVEEIVLNTGQVGRSQKQPQKREKTDTAQTKLTATVSPGRHENQKDASINTHSLRPQLGSTNQ